MSQLKNISGAKLTYIAATAAIAISEEFDNDDANILSSFFSAIGDNLGIIASQQEALSNSKSDTKNSSSDSSNNTNSDSNNKTKDDTNKESKKGSEKDEVTVENFV